MSVIDSLQIAAAVTACRAARTILRGLNRGGTSLPGRLAMWLRGDILALASEGVETILVTGTNGKTTTAGMLAHAMEEAGRSPLCNRSGANLLSGVTAEFVAAADLHGRPRRGQGEIGSRFRRRVERGRLRRGQGEIGSRFRRRVEHGRPQWGQGAGNRTCPVHPAARDCARFAVIECDEGALRHVAPLLHPRVIVVTNLFRDQLDRYGEVMHTLEAVREGIRLAPEAVLCLNADDSLTASLAADLPNPVIWFGMEESAVREKLTSSSAAIKALQSGDSTAREKQAAVKTDFTGGEDSPERISDARYCIRCGAEYTYRYHTYAHLGDFLCPSCGYARPLPDVAVTSIDRIDAAGSRVHMRIPENGYFHQGNARKGKDAAPEYASQENCPQKSGPQKSGPQTEASQETVPSENDAPEYASQEISVRIALPAVYNIYNAAAALSAYLAAALPLHEILGGLADVHSSFGRMEHFTVGGVSVQMILVKNPAGCNQALDYLCALKDPCTIVLCLNDLDADGHDISWIWDVDYEKLSACGNIRRILVWGKRAEDMQLRLKYAGIPESSVQRIPEKDLKKLLGEIYHSREPVFILPNYTTMLPLRDALRKAAGKASFWKG